MCVFFFTSNTATMVPLPENQGISYRLSVGNSVFWEGEGAKDNRPLFFKVQALVFLLFLLLFFENFKGGNNV